METVEILFFISAFIAEIIGTIAGFGSSTIFLPLSLLFVDFKTAIILVAIFHLFGNLARITFFRQGFDKKIILQFGVPSVLLSLLGAFLIGVLPQPILKLILGIFLSVTSISFLAKPRLISCKYKHIHSGRIYYRIYHRISRDRRST